MDERRKGRLHHFLGQILQGINAVQTSTTAKRFFEAVCSENDPVACVESILSSSYGLIAVQQAIRVDVTAAFFNSCIAEFLQYLQNPDIAAACGGELLKSVILKMVEAPIFWKHFSTQAEAGALQPIALQCFAWFLLQVVAITGHDVLPYINYASGPSVKKLLGDAAQPETRNLFRNIEKVLDTLQSPTTNEIDGPGGRHDNDFADFRKIALLPLVDELVCLDPPFLRFASEIEETAPEDRLAFNLDNQFRLLREDMLRDLKEELTGQNKKKVQKIPGLRLLGVQANHQSLETWTLIFACSKGLHFMPKSKNPADRLSFLKKNPKNLAHGSLACLFAAGVVIGFGTIRRQEDQLAQAVPLVHLNLPSSDKNLNRVLQGIRACEDIELLPMHTAIFAYEPILRQLQNIRLLPLADTFLTWRMPQVLPDIETTGPLNALISSLEAEPSMELKHDLQLSKSVKLDQSQASSLLAGLRQEVALIQGPPGTGKSFIGALIARALHVHTQLKILVLSYTNHALDQYLEDLIKIGIPQQDIVRLGSLTKASMATKRLGLYEQIKSKGYRLKRDDWSLIERHKEVAADVSVRMSTAFSIYTQDKASKKDIMDYLEFSDEFQDFFDAFQLPQDGTFRLIAGKGRTADEFYLLDCFARHRDTLQLREHTMKYPHIWNIAKDHRQILLKQWRDAILADRLQQFINYGEEYNREVAVANKVKGEGGRRLLQATRVIGCTTTTAAKIVNEIQSARPDVVIVEEAGEILESHVLASLGPATQRLVLIGDHKQLRPKVHYDLSVEKGIGYDLNRSLFEKLILKGFPHQKLSQQHRMRREISAFVRELTYPELTDAIGTKNRPDIDGLQDNIVFIDHKVLEVEGTNIYDPRNGGVSSSKTNDHEAQMTLKCVKYLAQQGYGSDRIVVLTPYLGQLRLLYDVLRTENDPVLNDLDSYDLVKAGLMPAAAASANQTRLRVSTIDNYQGEESDIVVASLTRSNQRGDIGFMSAPERLNVLISRARNGIILLGNSGTFLGARKGKELWTRFIEMLCEGQHIYDGLPICCQRHPLKSTVLAKPLDFDTSCPDGGCDTPCGAMLSCGAHKCPSRCHQLYDHSKMKCLSILTDKCANGHTLSWKCFEQRPVTCKPCDKKKKSEEERRRKEYERLTHDIARQKEHDDKIAAVDALIEIERQRVKDAALQEARNRAHSQKLDDLEKARKATRKAEETKKPNSNPQSSQATSKNVHSDEPSVIDETKSPQTLNSKAAQRWEKSKNMYGVTSDAIDDLMQLTGLETVKEWTLDLFDKIQTSQRQGLDITKGRLGSTLLGNPGTGKTTVARILAKLFQELEVISTGNFLEVTGAKLASDGVAGTKKMVEGILNDGGGVVFIDEAYQLVSGNNYGGAAVLDYLLAEIENSMGKLIFMFAGYEKQMEKFYQHNPGLPSRMPNKLMFEDYSESDLLHMLGRKIEKTYRGIMKVEGGIAGLYMRIVVRRLHRLSGQEGFGNARALENVLAKVSAAQAARLSRRRLEGHKADDFWFSKEDLIGPEPSQALRNSQARSTLQKMVGLDSVKTAVQTLVDRLTENYARELKEKKPVEVSLNRLFLGSPGTGKTTVAKLYGQILTEIGVLSSSECVVRTPADFIGSVIGESEKNTKAILNNTKGKVLVLDEAYMLSASSSKGDIYRTAVVDTIVSEVHSTPGDDRAVLLLGYEDQMKEMLRNANPGLARRFPLENAFYFEDYNDDQLRSILDHKLRVQGLEASEAAKSTAIKVLAKLRRRPNFGNAGEVENLLTRAKDNYSKRQKLSSRAGDGEVRFEPEDFDPDIARSGNAVTDCETLFKDVVGSSVLVEKLVGYIQSYVNAQELGMEASEVLPFNFVFKGPPGTGKTTTARKIGTVFYNMGFLGSDNVIECSATDLVGSYVGQTGPKVVAKFDEALGQVLFIDEAYRLGEGHFAKEAVDEMVDCLTKDKYKGKMLVILAGYEAEINQLLTVNPGLSSRFPEEVMFHNLNPPACIELLLKKLQKSSKLDIHLEMGTKNSGMAENLFLRLSKSSGWANGRDIETVASRTIANVLKSPKCEGKPLGVGWDVVLSQLTRLYTERERRSTTVANDSNADRIRSLTKSFGQMSFPSPSAPVVPPVSYKTATADKQPWVEEEPAVPDPSSAETPGRDSGVSDATWSQLELDKAKRNEEEAALKAALEKANREKVAMEEQARKAAEEAEQLKRKAAEDDEARRRHEAARLRAIELKRRADEEAERLRQLELEREKEREAQEKLRHMGVCVAGFRWTKQDGGYRCAGGAHFVSHAQLGQ